jgi:hypothetical protein
MHGFYSEGYEAYSSQTKNGFAKNFLRMLEVKIHKDRGLENKKENKMNRKDFYFIKLSIFKMLDTSTPSLANLTISPLYKFLLKIRVKNFVS